MSSPLRNHSLKLVSTFQPISKNVLLALLLLSSSFLAAKSYYPLRPSDLHAIYLTKDNFDVHADGLGDDSPALQQAVNQVEQTTHQGVVFVPEGRYRLATTVYVWEGIRLIGYGEQRPIFVLGRNTQGFQQESIRQGSLQQTAGHYMIVFADRRPPQGSPVIDASEFTFYSGVSNIDFELKDGNPAAVAIRFHVAQHGVLTHMDFHLGSAKAALEDIGNQASDIHIHGGQYGIITKKTSPAWQFLLMDSSFDGQSVAAIRTQEAGFTLIRDRFAHMPMAIEIPAGEVEQLYGRDLQFEDIQNAAFVLGNTKNLRSEVTLKNISCNNVPYFIRGTNSIRAPSKFYAEDNFSIGLDIAPDGRERGILMQHYERGLHHAVKEIASDIPPLPLMDRWVDVHSLGVKGDGGTDDTKALQEAIDHNPALFLPSGMYRLTGSLMLRPNTVLIGLNPVTTEFTLLDGTDNFQGDGPPIPLLIAPRGGTNIVTGIGISTGVANPRAAGVIWMAGERSMLDDVTFIPGHSAYVAALSPARAAPEPPDRTRLSVYLDTENPDLWVKDGGGGIFRGLWTHNSYAKAGMRVEDTATPSSVYQLSCEHHMHVEVQFHNVRNWNVYDLQTEEENPAGAEAVALEIENSRDLTFAATYLYRVSRNVLPKPYAAMVKKSSAIAFDNVKDFSQTRLAFDNAVFDEDGGVAVRAHHFTHFVIGGDTPTPPLPVLPPTSIFGEDSTLMKLATGFSNASGMTSDDQGNIVFTDAANHKIYRWNDASKQAQVIAEISGFPMVAGFVRPSTLLIVAYEKAVYSLNLANLGPPQLVPETNTLSPGTTLLLPVGLHNSLSVLSDLLERRGYVYRHGSNTAILSIITYEHRGYFYAPGTNTAIIAGGTWRPILQCSQLAGFAPGEQHFIASEDDARTYSARLKDDGKLATTVFTERGGTSVVTDEDGNVFIASSQVHIYDHVGKFIGALEVPERPGSLAFGGPDKRTLFIATRSSLYSIRTIAKGK